MKFRLGLAVIILMAGIREAHACSCYMRGDPAEAVAQSEVVFLGTVAATERVLVASDGKVFNQNRPGEGGGRPYRAVVLRVSEKWRGDAGPFVIVATGAGGGDCGYGFEVGKSYVVYAETSKERALTAVGGSSPVLTTSICSFTARAEDSVELLQRIRALHKPEYPQLWKEP